jgi:hypothetical protein
MHARLFLLLAASAFAAVPTERLRENETQQQQLQQDARALAGTLGAMLGEYTRNGLAGEDVEVVKRLREALDRMSAAEMKAVIDLLQKARAATDEGAARKTAGDAFAQQKSILTQMGRILAEHARNQQALELAQATAKLADRQAANLKNGLELARWQSEKAANDPVMQASLDGQKAEQAAIAEDLRTLTAKVGEFSKQTPTPEMAQRFQQGVAELERTQTQAGAAANALRDGQLFRAVTEEKAARDALRRIAKQIAPPQNDAEAMRAAERELARLAAEQKQIAEQVPKEKPDDLPALENAQGDLANKSDLIAQDLAQPAPQAAEAVRAAQAAMQEARAALADKAPAAAEQAAQAAQQALAQAQQAVMQQAAALENSRLTGNRAQDLEAMRAAAQALAQQQAARPNAAQQAAIAQQAAQLAQRAAPLAPNAAAALQQAAATAQQAMQNPAQQPQAAQQLAQAAQALAQQRAALQQAQQQLAQAQRAAEELGKIIERQQKLHLDTSTAHAKNERQVLMAQADRQRTIRTETEAFREQTGGPAPRESLNDASQNMRRAAQALEKPDGTTAVAAEQSAIDDLFRALAVLDQRMEQLRNELNEPNPEEPAAAAAAAAQLAQAQAALAAAQQAIAENQPAQAAAPAAQAAQQAGQVAAQGTALPQAAQQAAQQAAAQAAQAAAQAAGNQSAAAQQSAAAAQQSLAQAQAALSAAQSGLAAAPSQSSGQAGQNAAQSDQGGAGQGVERGVRALVSQPANFAGLPPRDRAAIQQSQGEKYPQEFGALVEQYLRNLADESAKK